MIHGSALETLSLIIKEYASKGTMQMTHSILWLMAFLSGLLPAVALAQQTQGPYYGHHMWNDGWGGWFFGPIMMLVFIAVAVVVIVLLVRWLGGPGSHGGGIHQLHGKTPLDILKERFARGEIDKDEFEERRRILGE